MEGDLAGVGDGVEPLDGLDLGVEVGVGDGVVPLGGLDLGVEVGVGDGVVPLSVLALGVEVGVPGAGDLAELVTDSSSSVLVETAPAGVLV